VSAHAEGVEWAEVSVSNLIEENRQLTERLAEREKEDVIALALWDGAVRELVKQRESARSIAARLEAELAIAERVGAVFTGTLQPENVEESPQCTSWAKFGMTELRCLRHTHDDSTQHQWGELTW
jgi:hypothetical protein